MLAKAGRRWRESRHRGLFGRWGRYVLRGFWLADLQRNKPGRFSDVLELSCAEIADREIEPPLHLPKASLGKTDRRPA